MWPVFLFTSEAGFSISYYVESHFSNTFNVFSTLSRPKSVLLFLWLPPVMSPSLLSCLFSWGFLCLPFLSQLTLLSSACFLFPIWFFLLWNAFLAQYNNLPPTHQLCYQNYSRFSLNILFLFKNKSQHSHSMNSFLFKWANVHL